MKTKILIFSTFALPALGLEYQCSTTDDGPREMVRTNYSRTYHTGPDGETTEHDRGLHVISWGMLGADYVRDGQSMVLEIFMLPEHAEHTDGFLNERPVKCLITP